jgi:hypothetical protein
MNAVKQIGRYVGIKVGDGKDLCDEARGYRTERVGCKRDGRKLVTFYVGPAISTTWKQSKADYLWMQLQLQLQPRIAAYHRHDVNKTH